MYPYVAPHAGKIHTLITLGIRDRTKALVFQALKHRRTAFANLAPNSATRYYVSQLRCRGAAHVKRQIANHSAAASFRGTAR